MAVASLIELPQLCQLLEQLVDRRCVATIASLVSHNSMLPIPANPAFIPRKVHG
jgi:hypothetical protein